MPDPKENHFDLFGLPVTFTVDVKRLAERYRALLMVERADPLSIGSEPDAMRPRRGGPSQIHEAYHTLKDPLARAEYLLELHHAWRRDDADSNGNGWARLMEQMEIRETLAEAASRPDPETAVATLLTELAERGAALDKALQSLFDDPSPVNLGAAREIIRQRRFLAHCQRDAEERQAMLELGA